MRVLVIAAATLVVAACEPATPQINNTRFVKSCSADQSRYSIVQLENGEIVASSSVKPRWEYQIIRVAPGVDPLTVCNFRSFRNQ